MDNEKWTTEDRPEPLKENFYQTGSTQPPKSRQGLIAFLLVAVIFLGSIASVLSLLNIRLFKKLNSESPDDASFRFSQEETPPSTPEQSDTNTTPSSTYSDVTIQLHQAPQSVENIPQEGGLSLQDIYSKNIASVVSVTCVSDSGGSTGSGVILSADGHIVTNSHVIDKARSVQVLFNDGTTRPAQVVGADAFSDLAVLYVEATGLSPAEFGNDQSLRVGDSVVAIGDPLGIELRGTMTNGIVSAINRDIQTQGRTMTLIQTNAALNAGNSGGPLLNCYGQVVGINTMKIGDNMSVAGVEGLGFAIPSTTVKEVVDQLLAQGFVSGRPSLGLSVQEISSFDQLYYRIPQGLYITEVVQDSDAAVKGLMPGDILLRFDDQPVTNVDALQQLLYAHNAQDTVPIVIYRNGKQYALRLTLQEAQ